MKNSFASLKVKTTGGEMAQRWLVHQRNDGSGLAETMEAQLEELMGSEESDVLVHWTHSCCCEHAVTENARVIACNLVETLCVAQKIPVALCFWRET